jgi:hypothetical protein
MLPSSRAEFSLKRLSYFPEPALIIVTTLQKFPVIAKERRCTRQALLDATEPALAKIALEVARRRKTPSRRRRSG